MKFKTGDYITPTNPVQPEGFTYAIVKVCKKDTSSTNMLEYYYELDIKVPMDSRIETLLNLNSSNPTRHEIVGVDAACRKLTDAEVVLYVRSDN